MRRKEHSNRFKRLRWSLGNISIDWRERSYVRARHHGIAGIQPKSFIQLHPESGRAIYQGVKNE